ncbi:Nif11-like leader peptide family RiPP precursor [Sporomusa sphaeroides]|jgi:predicted ribosomally synthesized peptide with nif11-like leader|uniref:Nif11-like leader peptide family RiPP precursor n=1 Tax=Sporomusa sphaeroides TaxID=47679 RepID=UPI003DA0CFD6
MSEIQRFNKDLNENKEMLEEVKNAGNDLAKIVAYANAKGYNFTVAELEASATSAELSEEQLDKVAGGVSIILGKVVVI